MHKVILNSRVSRLIRGRSLQYRGSSEAVIYSIEAHPRPFVHASVLIFTKESHKLESAGRLN